MKTFENIQSHLVPLVHDDIDTDQIIPARFLKITDKQGLGQMLFSDWRYEESGDPKPDFALNLPTSQGAKVLLAGKNFGSGSSREHAPWALVGWGFSAVVALSFADIFKNNALKNGLLPVVLPPEAHVQLVQAVEQDPKAQVRIDLPNQSITLPDGSSHSFPIDAFAKHCLLEGIDQLQYIQSFENEIQAYETSHAK